jgi:hypothetical protein
LGKKLPKATKNFENKIFCGKFLVFKKKTRLPKSDIKLSFGGG